MAARGALAKSACSPNQTPETQIVWLDSGSVGCGLPISSLSERRPRFGTGLEPTLTQHQPSHRCDVCPVIGWLAYHSFFSWGTTTWDDPSLNGPQQRWTLTAFPIALLWWMDFGPVKSPRSSDQEKNRTLSHRYSFLAISTPIITTD